MWRKRYREHEACPRPTHGVGFIARGTEIGVFWSVAIVLKQGVGGEEVHHTA